MASDETPDACGHEHGFQDNSACGVVQCLVEELQEGDKGGGRLEFFEIIHAEKLGDGEEPGCYEADGYGAHDCDGDLAFGTVDFFCEVGGAVEAGEGVVGVY